MIKLLLKITSILFILFLTSCERDDICIDPLTPKLIVRFYDKDNPTVLKKVNDLQVKIDSLGTYIPYGIASKTDSIAIPLRVDTDLTNYRFIQDFEDATNEISDDFTVNYEREFKFVSRSCGYKVVFDTITITNLTTNWIDHIDIKQQNILNEKEAHLYVYH